MSGPELTLFIDSDAFARQRQRELEIGKELSSVLGESALAFSRGGMYVSANGKQIVLGKHIRSARESAQSFSASAQLSNNRKSHFAKTSVQVTNETTLGAANRLYNCDEKPLALNLATGVPPGGGSLTRERAQEDALLRSSALYSALERTPEYANLVNGQIPDTSDWMIYTPNVPVFRTCDGRSLDRPWLLSVVTGAAPGINSAAARRTARIPVSRISRFFEVARFLEYTALVLGVWGCGAYGHQLKQTAESLKQALLDEFAGDFDTIVFAVADWSPDRKFIRPFVETFSR